MEAMAFVTEERKLTQETTYPNTYIFDLFGGVDVSHCLLLLLLFNGLGTFEMGIRKCFRIYSKHCRIFSLEAPWYSPVLKYHSFYIERVDFM